MARVRGRPPRLLAQPARLAFVDAPDGPGQGGPPGPLRPGLAAPGGRLPRAVPRPPRRPAARRQPGLRGILPPRRASREPSRHAVLRAVRGLERFAPLATRLPPRVEPGRRPAPAPRPLPERGAVFASFELREILARAGRRRSTSRRTGRWPAARSFSSCRTRSASSQPSWHSSTTKTSCPSTTSWRFPGSELRGLCMPYYPGATLDKVLQALAAAGQPRRAATILDVVGVEWHGRLNNDHPWKDFPATGTFAEGVAWLGIQIANALAIPPRQGHPPPRHQAGEYPDHPRQGAPAAGFQPGALAAHGRVRARGEQGRHVSVHGSRATPGVPRPGGLGRGGAGGRDLRVRASSSARC